MRDPQFGIRCDIISPSNIAVHPPFGDELIRRIVNSWISIARKAVHDNELYQPRVSTNKLWSENEN